MYNLSVQDLQDIAVRCTTRFLTDKTSLNESLAKEASDLGLNSEQVKRAAESTNSLAYLKTLEKSAGERAVEFPLADYNEIIKIASIPGSLLNPTESTPEAVKEQADPFSVGFPDLTTKEAMIGLHKQAGINARALEEAIGYSHVVASKLVKKAAEIRKDTFALDKLSAVVCDSDFEKVSSLVFGESKEKRIGFENVFEKKALEQAASLAALYKEATELLSEITSRTKLQKQAAEVLELEKQAGIGSFVGGLIGRAAGATANLAAKAIVKPVAAVATGLGKKVFNTVADTGFGKAVGATKFVPTTGQKIAGGLTLAGAGAALDASMYTPKTNPNSGNGGDVWNKLHGN